MSSHADAIFDTMVAITDVSQEAYRQGLAEGERQCAAKRAKLEAALEEALEYFEARYDTVDGDYGAPAANEEMRLGMMIETALGRRP